jgi:3-dehydroquinate dehydratase
LGVEIPFIELHVSNPHTREEFRHKSFLVDKAVAVIAGFGTKGYGKSFHHFILIAINSDLASEYAILHVCTRFKKKREQ